MSDKKVIPSAARAIALAGLMFACTSATSAPAPAQSSANASPTRDWTRNPSILQIDDAEEVYALSDPHGGYGALGRLLQQNRLIEGFSDDPARIASVRWTGGKAVLVIVGDLIDKGVESLGVIDLLRLLEGQAAAAGGRVVVTLGNHEAEFFADPTNKKARSTGPEANGIDNELRAEGIDPADLARGRDAAGRGEWLLNLPLAARVGDWFFAHAGNTSGDSIAGLEQKLSTAIRTNGYGDKSITGDDSILESQGWYGDVNKDTIGRQYAKALGVEHIAFGHDPGAFGDHGHILASQDRSLVKLDVAMGLVSNGANTGGLLLHVNTKAPESAEVLDASGARDVLWR